MLATVMRGMTITMTMTTTLVTAMKAMTITMTMATMLVTAMKAMTTTMVMRMDQAHRSSAPMFVVIWLPAISPMKSWLSRLPGCLTT